ncbi:transcriptional regulator swi6 [Podila humilis]|nr:transcriptional regulator swi6 [Podila humilis]
MSIYTAIYSGIPVYEMMCRGIAVMRRRDDSWLNATQILKVAGIEKGKRTKILEREVLPGKHEKVQGGYGKYQGTWVPFNRGKDLATEYKVEPYLKTLFELDVLHGDVDKVTPTKEMAMLAQRAKDATAGGKLKGASASPRMSPSSKRGRSSSAKPNASQTFSAASMTPSPLHPSFNASSPSIPPSPQWHTDPPPRKRAKGGSPLPYDHDYQNTNNSNSMNSQDVMDYDMPAATPASGLSHPPIQMEETLEGPEKYRSILMSIFLNDDTEQVPDLLADPISPRDLDIDLVIDDQGHTALHWAAALARIPVLELLVQKQADVRRVNFNGESALVRAVLVTNNYDAQSFPMLLSILHEAIPIVDRKNRTILHHIAVTAGIKGRGASSNYYMECLLEWIARNGGDFSSIVDVQDKNGDTALTIAARVGDQYLAGQLMDVGANRDIVNKVGLTAEDFGVSSTTNGSAAPFAPRTHSALANPKELQSGKKGKEIMSVVQKMVDELDLEFSQEIMARQGQLQDTQALLRHATRDLTETRQAIKQCREQAQYLAEAQQRIKNLEASLEEESQKTRAQKGYTSKLRNVDDIDQIFSAKKPTVPPPPPPPPPQTATATAAAQPPTSASVSSEHAANLAIREKAVEEELLRLKALVFAYQKNEQEMDQEMSDIKGKSPAKELQCKKVIAICCDIPLEKVDDLLGPLTLAVESDGASLDLGRVAGFMSRVKQMEGIASATTAAANMVGTGTGTAPTTATSTAGGTTSTTTTTLPTTSGATSSPSIAAAVVASAAIAAASPNL